MIPKILIIGACGQIGSELTHKLRSMYGNENVIASDIREGQASVVNSGPFEVLDATNLDALEDVIQYYEINEVYLMAAMLSATSEKFPMKGWHLNMDTLFNVLNLAKDGKIDKIFWPSSIAVFGLSTPKFQTPQHTIMDPNTVYGISKQTGERWCVQSPLTGKAIQSTITKTGQPDPECKFSQSSDSGNKMITHFFIRSIFCPRQNQYFLSNFSRRRN